MSICVTICGSGDLVVDIDTGHVTIFTTGMEAETEGEAVLVAVAVVVAAAVAVGEIEGSCIINIGDKTRHTDKRWSYPTLMTVSDRDVGGGGASEGFIVEEATVEEGIFESRGSADCCGCGCGCCCCCCCGCCCTLMPLMAELAQQPARW